MMRAYLLLPLLLISQVSVAAAAEHNSEKNSKSAYTAIFTCQMLHRVVPVLTCFYSSYIKVRSGTNVNVYYAQDIGMKSSFSIPLDSSFHIVARNSSPEEYGVLKIEIHDESGNTVYQDMEPQGSWVNVRN